MNENELQIFTQHFDFLVNTGLNIKRIVKSYLKNDAVCRGPRGGCDTGE